MPEAPTPFAVREAFIDALYAAAADITHRVATQTAGPIPSPHTTPDSYALARWRSYSNGMWRHQPMLCDTLTTEQVTALVEVQAAWTTQAKRILPDAPDRTPAHTRLMNHLCTLSDSAQQPVHLLIDTLSWPMFDIRPALRHGGYQPSRRPPGASAPAPSAPSASPGQGSGVPVAAWTVALMARTRTHLFPLLDGEGIYHAVEADLAVLAHLPPGLRQWRRTAEAAIRNSRASAAMVAAAAWTAVLGPHAAPAAVAARLRPGEAIAAAQDGTLATPDVLWGMAALDDPYIQVALSRVPGITSAAATAA